MAVATCTGTAAIHCALIAVGVKAHDLVICPGYTFIATANAVSYQHASPWLIDVDAENWTLDPSKVREALETRTRRVGDDLVHSETGQRIGAILPVYTLGNVADMQAIHELGEEFSLPVIADAAAAIGATLNGLPLSPLADLTTFSFNGNKTITSGGGGMLIGQDESLLEKARHISTTARVGADYDYDMVGHNYRMTNIQAAVGVGQMERLADFIKRKKEIRAAYDTAFREYTDVEPFPVAQWSGESVAWFSGFLLANDAQITSGELIDELNERGILARSFWKPVHLQVPYANCPSESLTVTNSIWSRVVTLPSSTGITDDELNHVISSVTEILR